jgi:hypothetical protein
MKLSIALVSRSAVSSLVPLKCSKINCIWIEFLFVTWTESIPISVRRSLCFGVLYRLSGMSLSSMSRQVLCSMIIRFALFMYVTGFGMAIQTSYGSSFSWSCILSASSACSV